MWISIFRQFLFESTHANTHKGKKHIFVKCIDQHLDVVCIQIYSLERSLLCAKCVDQNFQGVQI